MEAIQAEWKKDLNGSTLILMAEQRKESFTAKMLRYNRIQGLLPLELHDINGKREYRYETRGMKTMVEWLEENMVTQNLASQWMRQILTYLHKAEEYLLKAEDFILSAQYIFLNDMNDIFLCYLEGYDHAITVQLTELTGQWLDKLDYRMENEVAFAYDLYQCCRDGGCYNEIMRILEQTEEPEIIKAEEISSSEWIKETESEAAGENTPNPLKKIEIGIFAGGAVFAGIALYRSGLITKTDGTIDILPSAVFVVCVIILGALVFGKAVMQWMKTQREENDFDWGPLPGEDFEQKENTEILWKQETEVLREFQQTGRRIHLQDAKGKRVPVLQFPFLVGKEEGNHLQIEVSTVSRKHAMLLNMDNKVYIRDDGSTNGTRVNGEKLGAGVQKELNDGDVIEFAREKYTFYSESHSLQYKKKDSDHTAVSVKQY